MLFQEIMQPIWHKKCAAKSQEMNGLRFTKKVETAYLAFSIENQCVCYHRKFHIMKIMCVLLRIL